MPFPAAAPQEHRAPPPRPRCSPGHRPRHPGLAARLLPRPRPRTPLRAAERPEGDGHERGAARPAAEPGRRPSSPAALSPALAHCQVASGATRSRKMSRCLPAPPSRAADSRRCSAPQPPPRRCAPAGLDEEGPGRSSPQPTGCRSPGSRAMRLCSLDGRQHPPGLPRCLRPGPPRPTAPSLSAGPGPRRRRRRRRLRPRGHGSSAESGV